MAVTDEEITPPIVSTTRMGIFLVNQSKASWLSWKFYDVESSGRWFEFCRSQLFFAAPALILFVLFFSMLIHLPGFCTHALLASNKFVVETFITGSLQVPFFVTFSNAFLFGGRRSIF